MSVRLYVYIQYSEHWINVSQLIWSLKILGCVNKRNIKELKSKFLNTPVFITKHEILEFVYAYSFFQVPVLVIFLIISEVS